MNSLLFFRREPRRGAVCRTTVRPPPV